jgi:ketosteroid isomerase-like protein
MFEDTAEDAVFYDEFGGKTQGRQEIVDYFDNMFKTAPGMVMRIENTTARVVTPDVILTQSIYSLDMPGEMPALKGSSFTVSRISGDRSIMVELNNKFFAPQV